MTNSIYFKKILKKSLSIFYKKKNNLYILFFFFLLNYILFSNLYFLLKFIL